MRTKPYGSWTREQNRTRYYVSKWRPNRSLLVLIGVSAILLSVGIVFADVQRAGEESAAASPKDVTMRLTIPSMKRVKNVPVYNARANSKSALHDGALHLAGTGFPWQRQANVYIAGHRLGYPRTKSFLVFWDLNHLKKGRRVLLRDSDGNRYVYRVFDRFVVAPDDASATKPVEGKNIVSLQTCTLPNYTERLIVRARLEKTVQSPAPQASTE